VSSRVDRFLFSTGDGLGTLWFGTGAFILGFAAILGLVKGAWWTALLLVPACALAYQAWRSFEKGDT
jgi:membrane protein implicated in regulation of membrane protease activity